jgi:YHS domain-containing protein
MQTRNLYLKWGIVALVILALGVAGWTAAAASMNGKANPAGANCPMVCPSQSGEQSTSACCQAGCPMMAAAASEKAKAREQTTCPITGKPINKSIFVTYKGQKVYFCCNSCPAEFNKNPEKYLDKLPQFKTR